MGNCLTVSPSHCRLVWSLQVVDKPYLCHHWRAAFVVVDATNPGIWPTRFAGIGAGLASFVQASLGDRLIPVLFSSKTRSDHGWNFVGAVEIGRFRGPDLPEGEAGEYDTRQFWHEVESCQYEVLPGPGERVRWGVWDPPVYDGVIAHGHDDLLVSAALCKILDQQDWPGSGSGDIARRLDPPQETDQAEW